MEKRTLTLAIEGMTCSRCGEAVEQGLLKLRGVLEAAVDWEAGRALLTYDPGLLSVDEILGAPVFANERVIQAETGLVRHKYEAALLQKGGR